MEAQRDKSNGHLIDVNSASAEAISQGVKGIGPVLAQRIVAQRLAHGPFATLEQLVAIEGLSESLLQRIAGQITLGAEATRSSESPMGVSVAMDEKQEDAMAEGTSQEAITSDRQDDDELTKETGNSHPPEAPETVSDDELQQGQEGTSAPRAEAVEPLDPEDTPEAISEVAASELEQELDASAPELAESRLYTRTAADAGLSTWAPAPSLSDEEEETLASQEPDEPDWLMDMEEEPLPETKTPPMAPILDDLAEEETSLHKPEQPRVPAWDEPLAAAPVQAPAAAAPVSSAPAAAIKAEASSKREGGGFWRSLWLVLLGGLLGVLLTLAIAIIWTGTLDFASRPQVDAISRNVGTMQANQELAWQRIDELTVGSQELARQVAQLEQLRDTVGQMQTSLQQAEQELADTQASLDVLGEDVATLRTNTEAALTQLDERVGSNEEAVTALDATLTELESAFAIVEQRVGSFDGFFSNLRDLLIDMQGIPDAPAEDPAMDAARPETAAPADDAVIEGPAAPLGNTEPAPTTTP